MSKCLMWVSLIAATLLIAGTATAQDPGDIYWEAVGLPSFPDGPGLINTLTVYNGKLVAAGEFKTIDGASANSIAVWDGSNWTALGEGIQGSVWTLAVYDNKLIAGGLFTTAGCGSANNIAVWDGSSWSTLGLGVDSIVSALTVYGDKLIVGGSFVTAGNVAANKIASWDGASWSALGSGLDSNVSALAIYENKLIAGGSFATAGGVAAQSIAVWNDSSWSAFEDNTLGSSEAVAITVYRDTLIVSSGRSGVFYWSGSSWSWPWPDLRSPDSRCYPISALAACDSFLVVSDYCYDDFIRPVYWNEIRVWRDSTWSREHWNPVKAVACLGNEIFALSGSTIISWNGTAFSTIAARVMGTELSGAVTALTVYDDKLIAVRDFSGAVSDTVHNPVAWDGHSWSAMGTGIRGSIDALAVYENRLIVGGKFTTAESVDENSVAAWNGSSWSTLRSWSNCVRGMTVFGQNLILGSIGGLCCPQSPYCYCGGAIGDVSAWDGSFWRSVGPSGMLGKFGGVYASWAFDDELFVYYKYVDYDCWMPGSWSGSEGLTAWDGSSWKPMISYVGPSEYMPSFEFSSLLVYGEKMIAMGQFDSLGTVAANHIAAWDGTSWSALGAGLEGVCSMIVYDNKLIVFGDFSSAGGVAANNIAAWDGSSWSPLGSGLNCAVHALTVFDNKLVVFGDFSSAGGVAANNIAAWDGSSWSPLGSGLNCAVHAFTVFDNKLIAAGCFDHAGATPANHIAAWDGSSWSALGSGLNGEVTYFAGYDASLVVGGNFTTAGGKVSPYLAMWTKRDNPTGVDTSMGRNLPGSFELSQNYPNPFNPTTVIEYSVSSRSQVTIEVFNVLGQKVRTLVDVSKPAGEYRIEWNGSDDAGKPVSTGVYLYRFQAGNAVQTKKMLLIK